MLDRNRRIKKCPERFQDTKEQFDIIVTVEERVYDLVVMHMESMESVDNRPVHVLNVDVVDNAEDALMGAFVITDMINMVWSSVVHSLNSPNDSCAFADGQVHGPGQRHRRIDPGVRGAPQAGHPALGALLLTTDVC